MSFLTLCQGCKSALFWPSYCFKMDCNSLSFIDFKIAIVLLGVDVPKDELASPKPLGSSHLQLVPAGAVRIESQL